MCKMRDGLVRFVSLVMGTLVAAEHGSGCHARHAEWGMSGGQHWRQQLVAGLHAVSAGGCAHVANSWQWWHVAWLGAAVLGVGGMLGMQGGAHAGSCTGGSGL